MSPEKREQTSTISSEIAKPDDACWLDPAERTRRVEDALHYHFQSPDLLQQALVHSSYLNEQLEAGRQQFDTSNERLEFLGDAVLGFIVADYLYRRHSEMDEGELTVNRATLVRRETLANWAQELGLDDVLYIARGESRGAGQVGDRIMAGTFEAVLGALYLDQGIEPAREVIERMLDRDVDRLLRKRDLTNYKGQLQEIIQEQDQELPEYEVVEMTGPAHNRYFVVRAVHHDATIGQGGGRSKRAAEQAAAKDALERMRSEGRHGGSTEEEPDDHGRAL